MSLLIKSEEIIVDSADYNSDEGDEVHLALDDSGGEGYQTVYTETISTQKHQPQSHVTSSPRGCRTVTIHQLQNQQNNTTGTPSSKNQQSVQPIQTTKVMMENEKRLRREIANSNERRRMQSINAGFQSLRSLLPHHEGEKLSKKERKRDNPKHRWRNDETVALLQATIEIIKDDPNQFEAAILQQTAQYILDLESEKTQLLSQNSQLKRQHCQHEGCTNAPKSENTNGTTTGTNGTESATALKKRKLTDNVISMQAISDSSDEGLGSMSPEPVTLITANGVQIHKPVTTPGATTAYISSTGKEVNELKVRLENERKRRRLTEERVRILEKKLHQFEQDRQVQQQHHYSIQREVIEHTDNIREEEYEHIIHQPIYTTEHDEIKIDPTKLQVVELNDLPNVGQAQVVICSQMEDMQDDEAAEIITADIQNIREEVIMTDETTEILEVPSRLQPILEAAIKAEPKVEVERINATLTKRNEDGKRMYLTSTSRQNLETIVEAIRHLEGDHLFADSSQMEQEHKKSPQEAPLALTTTVKQHQIQTQHQQHQQQQQQQLPQIHQIHTQALTTQQQRKLTSDLSPFLQLKAKPANVTIVGKTANSSNNSSLSQSSLSNPTSNSTLSGSNSGTITLKQHSTTSQSQIVPSTIITTQLKQCRPGVIVAKQVS